MAEGKEIGRSEGKEIGRSEGKEIGRSEGKEIGRGGRDGSFGAGAGWVVVSFISPVGIDVTDLAARMLQGRSPQPATNGGNRRLGKLSVTGAIAQAEERKAAVQRAKYSNVIPKKDLSSSH